MASEALFQSNPPFPDDVATADVSTISLANLVSGDEKAAKDLFDSCKGSGFFFLNLYGDSLGAKLVQEIDELFQITKNLFDLPEAVKMKHLLDFPKSFLGFKPLGLTKTDGGQIDRYQSFNIGQDGLLGITSLQSLPDVILNRYEQVTSFLKHGREVVSIICECLSRQLSLPSSTFAKLQPLDQPSGTTVRLIKADASHSTVDVRSSMASHSDIGTVTLLANVLGGLQILPPGTKTPDEDAWLWIRPRPGCLIVNMGDAMAQWTGGTLRSGLHRVNFAPGEQRYAERYSLGILVRPEKNASMKRLVGKERNGESFSDDLENLTAWEWEVKKLMSLKSDNDAQQK